MKKSTLFTTIAFAFVLLLTTNVNAQKFAGLDKSPMDGASFPSDYKISKKDVKIVYGRPQLNGRSLSELAPNGKQWRTGANEAAEITFYKDMTVAGTKIKAGTYTMSTIPGENEWTIIFSSDLNVWGSYFYNEANDVARVTAKASMGDESLEAFSIMFDEKGTMHMGWDKVRVAVPMN
ncbi:MAG: asparagine synthetase B [Bacteroidetes bacterium]|nr:MAG: asparagine synthetase B [Bacteroidota bacterium]